MQWVVSCNWELYTTDDMLTFLARTFNLNICVANREPQAMQGKQKSIHGVDDD
jgi:hypothetical protein